MRCIPPFLRQAKASRLSGRSRVSLHWWRTTVLLCAIVCGATSKGAAQEAFAAPPGYTILREVGLRLHAPADRRDDALLFRDAWDVACHTAEYHLGSRPAATVDLILYSSRNAFQEAILKMASHEVSDWVAGVAIPRFNRILIRLDIKGSRHDRVDGLLAHEVAHLVIHQGMDQPNATSLPRWLDEGMAQVVQGRVFTQDRANLNVRAFLGQLMSFEELSSAFPGSEGGSSLAYSQSESFVRFMVRHGEPPVLKSILESLRLGVSLDDATLIATGYHLTELEEEWIKELKADKSWLPNFILHGVTAIMICIFVFIALRKRWRTRRAHHEAWDAEELERGVERGL